MMKQEQAETVALQALAYIAADEDRMDRFVALSGLGPDDLKAGLRIRLSWAASWTIFWAMSPT